jgi:UPF0176 protein
MARVFVAALGLLLKCIGQRPSVREGDIQTQQSHSVTVRLSVYPYDMDVFIGMFQKPTTFDALIHHHSTMATAAQHQLQQHSSIILFYKYFLPSDYPWLHENPRYYEQVLLNFLKDVCDQLELKGRLLVAAEGVNGTLSAPSRKLIDAFILEVESFDMPRDVSEKGTGTTDFCGGVKLFSQIDWKHSTSTCEPFPDLKIAITKEIISSGGAVSVEELKDHGGKHLEPSEFHRAILDDPNVVLIDVRNPIEYEIGHFIHPSTTTPAINPAMVTFASFDSGFCAKQADALKDKKVLMYCTGGIRCEKASAMLKKRGVSDVSQLKGGIHRYLEEYGDEGYFKGLNFVFDRRVAMSGAHRQEKPARTQEVIGRCFGCERPFEDVTGATICTVCRDVCSICESCQSGLREYHCRRHAGWKKCYFTFLEVFDRSQLESQRQELISIRERLEAATSPPGMGDKNIRRTLTKQIDKVTERIRQLDLSEVTVNEHAPRRCRSCFKSATECDGCCWGFWKAPQPLNRPGSADTRLP